MTDINIRSEMKKHNVSELSILFRINFGDKTEESIEEIRELIEDNLGVEILEINHKETPIKLDKKHIEGRGLYINSEEDLK